MIENKTYQEITEMVREQLQQITKLNVEFEGLKKALEQVSKKCENPQKEIQEFENILQRIVENRCTYWKIEEEHYQLHSEMVPYYEDYFRWIYANYYERYESSLEPWEKDIKKELEDYLDNLDEVKH